jgi:hypothetical protein
MNSPYQLHLSLPPDLTAPHTSDSDHAELLYGVQSCHACLHCEAVLQIGSEAGQQQLCGHQSMPSAMGCNPTKHIMSPL